MGAARIEIADLDHRWGEVVALTGITAEIPPGQLATVVGPSGSGKTTLLQVLGGLLRPTVGSLALDGRSLAGLDLEALARVRLASFGFVFQAYNLFPTLTAGENVEVALDLVGTRGHQLEGAAQDLGALAGSGRRPRLRRGLSRLDAGHRVVDAAVGFADEWG